MNATLTETKSRPSNPPTVRTVRPKADIYETSDAWMLRIDLPGADENSIELSLEKQVLTIKAAGEDGIPEGFERVYTEFLPRGFERAFRLPDEVDRSAIDANIKNGVLHLTLPKSKEARPHQIAVKAG